MYRTFDLLFVRRGRDTLVVVHPRFQRERERERGMCEAFFGPTRFCFTFIAQSRALRTQFLRKFNISKICLFLAWPTLGSGPPQVWHRSEVLLKDVGCNSNKIRVPSSAVLEQHRVRSGRARVVVVHPQVPCEKHNILQFRNNRVRRGSGGRDCAIQVWRMCRAEGPTHFLQFVCGISAHRPPPEKVVAKF